MRPLAAVFLLATVLSPAQQPQAPRPDSGWVSLFNGKDLTGWKPVGNEKWTVEDGAIHGQGASKDYGYLETERSYESFHLSLRFKCEASGNSGVFFHSRFKPGTVDIVGLQAEIDPVIGHHTGGLYGTLHDGTQGWLVWPAPENETVIRSYEWNEMLLRVEGNRVRVRLNGVDLIDFTNPRPAFTSGTIALQLHSGGLGNMRFKDLLIRDLGRR